MLQIPPTDSILAVDGGGTRCRLVVSGSGGRVQVEVGAANVSSDFPAAIAQISGGLDAIAAKLSVSVEDLASCPAYLGLAGVTGTDMAQRVSQALPFRHCLVEDDRRAALRGALGRHDGALAHFGTGSFFAVQVEGQAHLSGGWGWRLGDEGSAFWLAREALSATLNAVDGVAPGSPLTEALLKLFGSSAGIVAYAAETAPGALAALAPQVTAAARCEDVVACRIMQRAAEHIEAVVTAMGWQPGMDLCLTGGLGPEYRDVLPEALKASVVAPKAAPLEGAIALARDFAAEVAS